MSTQPDALGYAVCLDARGFAAEAAELRRLHAVNAELLEALKRLVYQDSSGDWRVVQLNGQVTEIVSAVIAKAEEVKL